MAGEFSDARSSVHVTDNFYAITSTEVGLQCLPSVLLLSQSIRSSFQLLDHQRVCIAYSYNNFEHEVPPPLPPSLCTFGCLSITVAKLLVQSRVLHCTGKAKTAHWVILFEPRRSVKKRPHTGIQEFHLLLRHVHVPICTHQPVEVEFTEDTHDCQHDSQHGEDNQL